jgi:hypothetical protein
MRSITNLDRHSGDNLLTLPDVSAALGGRTAAPAANDTSRTLKPATSAAKPAAAGGSQEMAQHRSRAGSLASLAIPKALADAADATLAAALAGAHPVDPLLGSSLSCLTSAVNSAVKRSGALIEKSIIAGLEQAGYLVFPQLAMQLTDAAKDLVRRNPPGSLRGVVIKADAPTADEPVVVFDLLAVHPGRRRATLIEVKRGNGLTELRKVAPITATLLAGGVQATSFLRARGIKVRAVEAKVIDYYGRSGFADDVRITGDQIDTWFKAPIQPLVEAVLTRVKTQLFTAVPDLLNTALVQARSAANDNAREADDIVTLPGGANIARVHLPAIESGHAGKVRTKSRGAAQGKGRRTLCAKVRTEARATPPRRRRASPATAL